MRIEPIDLRRKKKASGWWTSVNTLLAVSLVGALAYQHWSMPAEEDEGLLAPRVLEGAARTPAQASQATPPVPPSAAPNVKPAFDWDSALLALEKVDVEGVTVSSFHIDARDMVLALSFANYQALATYESNLNAQLGVNLCKVKSAAIASSASIGQGDIVCRWR